MAAVRGTIGILGGAFDPPHLGHVAVARGGVERFGLTRLLVRVIADPGHKDVPTPAEVRLTLARVAFAHVPEAEVALDPYSRTVDSLHALGLDDPVFLIGSDEFVSFLTWKEPDRVLAQARLGVATRPGVDAVLVEKVLSELAARDRVTVYPIEPHPISSTAIRARVAEGFDVTDLVGDEVAEQIRQLGLYNRA
ncbi:MAG: hypothetical protein U0R50_17205 [Gaiellales bacterium]